MRKNLRRLVECLEIRKAQLMGERHDGYKLHRGHHLRDVMTVLAVLRREPYAAELLNKMESREV